MNTRFYFHPIFMEHDTGPHPERPERLQAILEHMKERHGEDFATVSSRRAELDEITTVHHEAYLASLEGLCKRGGGYLDGDTPVCDRSFEAALYAAGALLDGADALVEGAVSSVFTLVRPPGHHARPGTGMGFCLVGNIAVAARYLQQRHGLDRVLIADFDVHHGNGTQEMFYGDGSVYFLSIHRYPFYPGTGSAAETGGGKGLGKTRNLPVAYGTEPEKITAAFDAALEEAAAEHEPGMILVSAGFDGYAEDPIAGIGLYPEHYEAFGRAVRKAADRHCGGKVLTTLEGGYALTGLPLCLDAYLEGLG